MAHVVVTHTLTPIRTIPFSGRPMGTDENNIYPRARIVFQSSDTITAKIATNTQTVIQNLDLPANFYYTFDGWFTSIGSTTSLEATQYLLDAVQFINTLDPASALAITSVIGATALESASGSRQCYRRLDVAFSEVFGNQDGNAPRIATRFTDDDVVNSTDELTLSTYATFLQYDVRQADQVRVNAPMPVRVR